MANIIKLIVKFKFRQTQVTVKLRAIIHKIKYIKIWPRLKNVGIL